MEILYYVLESLATLEWAVQNGDLKLAKRLFNENFNAVEQQEMY